MNTNKVQGSWQKLKGKIKEKWGKLTDNDLIQIEGKFDQLEGRLQERYGYQKEQAKKEAELFCREHNLNLPGRDDL